MSMPEPAKRRNLGKAVSNGQPPSDEYNRFESVMKRLVKVPKKDIDARREAERKRG